MDPYFLELMEDIKALLRYSFQTKNDFTIPVSGTGSAAMEACICNMVEPGDKILIGVNGYFGNRLCDMASRYGATVCDSRSADMLTVARAQTKEPATVLVCSESRMDTRMNRWSR